MTGQAAIPKAEDPSQPVIAGAAQLFRRKGFAATTVREIAAAAGMLPGSLHYRFASKEELLLALMERGIERATTTVRLAIAEVGDPVERLRVALRAHLRILLSEDEAVYVLLYEGRGLTGDARAAMVRLRDRFDALWDGILHSAAGTGRLRPTVDLRLVRLLLIGAANWTAQWYSSRGKYSSDEIADAYANIVLNGLLVDSEHAATSRRRRPASSRRK